MKRGDLIAVIDMQRAYVGGEWNVPEIARAERNIMSLLACCGNAVFTRHVESKEPKGTWARYNKTWAHMSLNGKDQLLESLAVFAEGRTFEKTTYSAFGSERFAEAAEGAERLIICGVETEFCVLATLMDAVDRGIETVFVFDACAGEREDLEGAVLDIALRMPCQVTVMSTNELLLEE